MTLDGDTARGPLAYWPHELTAAPPNALLVTPAGDAVPVNLPVDPAAWLAAVEQHLGGKAECTHYTATCPHDTPVVSLAVLEDSDGMPVNYYASLAFNVLRHDAPRTLKGPALLMGPAGKDGAPTDLHSRQRVALEQLMSVLRAELRIPTET
ncbi:hypothetical protein [Kitasatospora sp. NPDC058478]|uniref:hypothetical protein n=1 Tax=unclassified Kitasatospora TaxID=2633591 RepID=UPI0036574EEA